MLGIQHTLVLPYLENLCAHDETVVRERAVSSITKLLDLYTDNDINNYIIPLVSLSSCRSLDWHQMRLISLAEYLLHFLCAMSTQGLDPTRKKSDSKLSFTQQVFRHFERGDVAIAKSHSN